MPYHMLGTYIHSVHEVEDVNNVIKFLILSRYNPHLWNSVVTYNLLGPRVALVMRKLTHLPQDKAMSILRESMYAALDVVEG